MFSIMYGNVRLSTAKTWPDAQAALRESIESRIQSIPRSIDYDSWAAKLRQELTELAGLSDPSDTRVPAQVWLSEWDGIVWKDDGSTYGAGIGDLCYVRDYSNGHMSAWTINVKAKVTGVYQYTYGPQVVVRITGDSLQFRRHGELSMPATFIRTRKAR